MNSGPGRPLGRGAAVVLALGVLLQALALGWGLHELRDQPAYHDGPRYMGMVHRCFDAIDEASSFRELLHELSWTHETHPPLIPLTFAASAAIFGETPSGAAAANVLYLALTQLLIASIACRLGWRWAGVYGALLFGLLPVVTYHALQPLQEAGLTFFVAAAVWTLLRSEGFARAWWSLGFGILCGLGLLAKWTFVLFVAPVALLILLAAALGGLRPLAVAPEVGWGRRFANVGLALVSTLCVSLPWYGPHGSAVLEFARFAEVSAMYASESSSWDWIYVTNLPRIISPPVVFAFAVAAPIGVLVTRARFLVPSIWLIVPFVVLSLMSTKTPNGRHLVPALPALALMTAIGLRHLPIPGAIGRVLRHLAPASLLLCLVPTYLYHVVAVDEVPAHLAGCRIRFGNHYSDAGTKWPVGDALQAIECDSRNRGNENPSIVVLSHRDPRIAFGAFLYLANERKVRARFINIPFYVAIGNPYHVHPPLVELLDADYVVTERPGFVREAALRPTNRYRTLVQGLLDHPGASAWQAIYEPIYRTDLPLRGFRLVVLRRSLPLPPKVEVAILRQLIREGDPDHPALYERLAESCRRVGLREAASAAEELARSVASLETSNRDEAMASYARAVRMDPTIPQWFGKKTVRTLVNALAAGE